MDDLGKIWKVKENLRKVEETARVETHDFDIFLQESQKRQHFNGRKLRVYPTDTGALGEIIRYLVGEKEMQFFAELVKTQIQISVKMQNGKEYKEVYQYTDLNAFEKDFFSAE